MRPWRAAKFTGGCMSIGIGLLVILGQHLGSGPRAAQAELPKEKVEITTKDGKRHAFDVEVATTERQQEVGEMFRKAVSTDGGMLFDWHKEVISRMWMRHTLVPLDMLFIGRDATIKQIAANTTPNSLTIISSEVPVTATLEVAGGTASRLGIATGDMMRQLSAGAPSPLPGRQE